MVEREGESAGSPVEAAYRGTKLAVAFDRSFDALYGLQYEELSEGRIAGRVELGPQHHGAGGFVHSGVYAAIAESLASIGTAATLSEQGVVVSGLSNSTHVVGDVATGVLRASASCRARHGSEWFWDVDVLDGDGARCAVSTVVIAVRPARDRS